MSEDIKKAEQIENVENEGELSEGALDGVAGGKTYFGSRSNIAG